MANNKLLAWYALPVFVLGWGLQICALFFAGNPESPDAEPWLIATMFIPGMVTLCLVSFSKMARAQFLWRPTLRIIPLIPVAVLVPASIAFGVVALALTLGWGVSGWFTFIELVGVSFFLGWLTLRSKSFWLAAVAHGAGNSIQAGVTQNLQLIVPQLVEDFATITFTLRVGLVCLYWVRHADEGRAAPPQVEMNP